MKKTILTAILTTFYGLATPLEAKASAPASPAIAFQTKYAPNHASETVKVIPIAGPKTVHVRGYYRKDGTYVRSHYRSRPTRHAYSKKYYSPSRSYSKSYSRTYSRRK